MGRLSPGLFGAVHAPTLVTSTCCRKKRAALRLDPRKSAFEDGGGD
jgi:hypothetical protein